MEVAYDWVQKIYGIALTEDFPTFFINISPIKEIVSKAKKQTLVYLQDDSVDREVKIRRENLKGRGVENMRATSTKAVTKVLDENRKVDPTSLFVL